MKTIKRLKVEVTYNIELLDVEVPDEVYEVLSSEGQVGSGIYPMSGNEEVALEWLGENIHEADALDWEYEYDGIDYNSYE